MAEAFFLETEACRDRITELFEFAWPTAAALWNLRWQVRGFLNEVPDATKEQLDNRFLFGSDIPTADLKATCIRKSWADQKQVFAGFILSSAVAAYEHWSEGIARELGVAASESKKLQFEDAPEKQGVQSFVVAQTAVVSVTIEKEFYDSYVVKRKYAYPIIGNLMKCYRYYKEIRNSLMHGGGIANARAEQAYLDFLPVSDRTSLGMRGALQIEPLSEGQPVVIHLRGVVGFCDVLIRILHSIDTELSRSKKAEASLKARLSRRSAPQILSADKNRRRSQIAVRCQRAGLPRPRSTEFMYEFMRDNRLIGI